MQGGSTKNTIINLYVINNRKTEEDQVESLYKHFNLFDQECCEQH